MVCGFASIRGVSLVSGAMVEMFWECVGRTCVLGSCVGAVVCPEWPAVGRTAHNRAWTLGPDPGFYFPQPPRLTFVHRRPENGPRGRLHRGRPNRTGARTQVTFTHLVIQLLFLWVYYCNLLIISTVNLEPVTLVLRLSTALSSHSGCLFWHAYFNPIFGQWYLLRFVLLPK
jgi:hypothetical protein